MIPNPEAVKEEINTLDYMKTKYNKQTGQF